MKGSIENYRIERTKKLAFRVLDLVRGLPQNGGFHILILYIKVFKRREPFQKQGVHVST
jgi:hypothetical protein